VTTIRIMTYNIHGCRGGDETVDPDRILRVISEGAPDIVALQEVDAASGRDHLAYLAKRLGMAAFGLADCDNAFLSYYPLRGIRSFDLRGGSCLQADLDIGGKRLHLINLRLDVAGRHGQMARLLGSDILGSRNLVCPILVLGDFADLGGGLGSNYLSGRLRRARGPLWSATYPARLPLVTRDRAYLCGDLRLVDARVPHNLLARRASSHLPLVLTVQICDPRTYLKIEKISHRRMEIAPG
jgi:endonuclease/exonuclease/phosphatase family metal-dependent hydrolase